MAIEVQRRAWTVDEYYRMAAAGVLSEDDRVELIEGEIVEMSPIGVAHARCTNWLTARLVVAAGDRALVRIAQPVRLSDRSEPEPDVSVVGWRDDFYADAHPTAAEVALLIEISVTSLAFDRLVKVPLYARSAIPEVWVVDLEGRAVEVYDGPTPDGYERCQVLGPGAGAVLTVPGLDGCTVPVAELLG